jgi:hypothetical protein
VQSVKTAECGENCKEETAAQVSAPILMLIGTALIGCLDVLASDARHAEHAFVVVSQSCSAC